jgi:hypothetical protein
MSPTRRLLSLSLLAACAACGSIPKKQFEFRAIDTGDQPRPCMIVVDDDWAGAAEKSQFVNLDGSAPLTLTLPFTSAEVEITVAPVLVESGKVARVPKSRKEARDYSGYMDDVRRLRLRDAPVVLFILVRKSTSS